MRAFQLVGFGKRAEFRDVAEPEPGPGEVLIRVGGAGACHSDLHLMDDFSEGMLPVESAVHARSRERGLDRGSRPRRDRLRDRRAGRGLRAVGMWSLQALPAGHGELLRAAERRRRGGRWPRSRRWDGAAHEGECPPRSCRSMTLAPLDAAPLTDAGLTPYHAIKRSLPLLVPGSSAVVIGAGGLGHMAVQILSALTATTVIAVDRNPARAAPSRTIWARRTS